MGIFLGLTIISVALLTTLFKIGNSVLQTACGVSWLVFVAAVVLFIFYRFYFPTGDKKPVSKLRTEEDFTQSLKEYEDSELFHSDIETMKRQIERFNRKKSVIGTSLLEKFDPNELSYGKFLSVVSEVEKTFFINIRNVLSVLRVFDESEYQTIGDQNISRDLQEKKRDVYDDYLETIKKSMNLNEAILISLDNLLSEISKLSIAEMDDMTQLTSMQEMNDLIQQTKYYK